MMALMSTSTTSSLKVAKRLRGSSTGTFAPVASLWRGSRPHFSPSPWLRVVIAWLMSPEPATTTPPGVVKGTLCSLMPSSSWSLFTGTMVLVFRASRISDGRMMNPAISPHAGGHRRPHWTSCLKANWVISSAAFEGILPLEPGDTNWRCSSCLLARRSRT